MRLRSTILITLAALAGAGSASAQTRDGFFLGGGLGYGWGKVEADEFGDSDREGGLTLNLRLGTTLSTRLGVGVELNGWFDSEEGDSVSLYNATVAAYVYPSDAGLFVKGGLGLARAGFDIEDNDLSGVGFGFMLGAGYDFAIGDSLAVTPQFTAWFGSPGDLKVDDIDVLHGFKHNVFEIGVGITFY
jgi:hypothetical protein